MDLAVQAFLKLRSKFYTPDGQPIPFHLREKRNTQDDPFDEFLTVETLNAIPNVTCVKAPGPLVTPDIVLFRDTALVKPAESYRDSLVDIIAIEVKKLEREERGNVARSSGLDYNTTPPCGTVCIYDRNGDKVWVRGFYLFVCLESVGGGAFRMTAMVLIDGNSLNSDEQLYRTITVDSRSKEINLGSYGDGANRVRPMLIFGNPLGVPHMNRAVTLIHPDPALDGADSPLRKIATLRRTRVDTSIASFTCYRYQQDFPIDGEPLDMLDPFPTPKKRDTATKGRGRFNLPFSIRR